MSTHKYLDQTGLGQVWGKIKDYVNNNSTLVDLTDTSISSPVNGQVLMYNSTTSKWENTSLPIYNGGVSS